MQMMVRHTSNVPTVDRIWSKYLKYEPNNRKRSPTNGIRGVITQSVRPCCANDDLIDVVLYEFRTTQSITFPPVYIWSCYTPVLDLAIKNGSLCIHEMITCCPLCVTWFIVRCSFQLRWAVVILRGSPGLWSHTILVVKLCFPKSHTKTFISQIPKLHKAKTQHPKIAKHALLRIYVVATPALGASKVETNVSSDKTPTVTTHPRKLHEAGSKRLCSGVPSGERLGDTLSMAYRWSLQRCRQTSPPISAHKWLDSTPIVSP